MNECYSFLVCSTAFLWSLNEVWESAVQDYDDSRMMISHLGCYVLPRLADQMLGATTIASEVRV